MPTKPKTNYSAKTASAKDRCQTPPYALLPLYELLRQNGHRSILESAAGDGYIYRDLKEKGYRVSACDILPANDWRVSLDFFKVVGLNRWDCQVTNPPFSLKYKWVRHSFESGVPFALLLPTDIIGAASFWTCVEGMGIDREWLTPLIITPRVNFIMPEKGQDGKGAQFSTAWLTYGLVRNPGIGIRYQIPKAMRGAYK